jgi:hypothetical protein
MKVILESVVSTNLDIYHFIIVADVYIVNHYCFLGLDIVDAIDYLRNKSWKPECVGSFNMDGLVDISILSQARSEG